MRKGSISNITTSEGQLRRYTLITGIIGPKGHKKTKEIMKKMESERWIRGRKGLTNNRVKLNHLYVTRKLGITESSEDMQRYVLRGPGKALLHFWNTKKKSISDKFLSPWEKIFYFRCLFLYHFDQFYQFLLNLERNNRTREEIILDYFTKVQDLDIVDPNKLKKSVNDWNSSKKISRFLENIFTCTEMWFKQLGLVKLEKNLKLTERASKILSALKTNLNQKKYFENNICQLSLSLCNIDNANVESFDYQIHKEKLRSLIKESYFNFKTSLDMADLEATRCWISIEMLLNHNLILEEKTFDRILNNLVNDGVIRSVIGSERGGPKYFVIQFR